MNSFDRWWSEEGSAMRPMPTEDVEEFAKRVSQIAWSNGAYIFANQPEPVPGAFNPGNFDAIATIATQPAAQQRKPEHITNGNPCWCNPEIDYVDPETGVAVIVHKEPQ
jgi:hypothetical protein